MVGSLIAEDEVTISSQASGNLADITVDLGTAVRSGQVIYAQSVEALGVCCKNPKAPGCIAQPIEAAGPAGPPGRRVPRPRR